MSGFVSPIAYNPSSIPEEAAFKAAAGSGKRKIPSGVISNLANKSRRMAYEFQESMQKHVKKKLDSMSGPEDNRKRGLKVAQFIPGKGLEVPSVQANNDIPITCSLGLKGAKIDDALEKTFDIMKGKNVSMDFAFKLICDPDLSSKNKKSRITAINCFRHVNPASFSYKLTGAYEGTALDPLTDDQVAANKAWHSTLGPDASYIRRGPNGLTTAGVSAGTWRGGDSDIGGLAQHYDATNDVWDANDKMSKIANSLYSPYRYPLDFELMFSRVNRQVLENFGFTLNRWRLMSSVEDGHSNIGNSSVPQTTNLQIWKVPNSEVLNFGDTSGTNSHWLKNSFPAQINNAIVHPSGSRVPGTNKFDELYEWHSQFGPGKLNYQFSNDGNNPVCIDICIVAVKKSDNVSMELMKPIFKYNYLLEKYRNNKRMNLNGYDSHQAPTLDSDLDKVDFDFANDEWHTDGKLPFIPNECFKNPQSYLEAADFPELPNNNPNNNENANHIVAMLEQGKSNPFKLVKRDQFIVSSGATRAWNTTLPSIKYRPQLYEDVEYPLTTINAADAKSFATTADEYTFALIIGASGVSKPVEELYPGKSQDQSGTTRTPQVLKSTITDHEPSSCNVSVVGTYTETVYPAYPKDVSDKSFINGRLTLPYFSETDPSGRINVPAAPGQSTADRLSTVDISTQAQIVRVTDDGLSGVGAINTENGA